MASPSAIASGAATAVHDGVACAHQAPRSRAYRAPRAGARARSRRQASEEPDEDQELQCARAVARGRRSRREDVDPDARGPALDRRSGRLALRASRRSFAVSVAAAARSRAALLARVGFCPYRRERAACSSVQALAVGQRGLQVARGDRGRCAVVAHLTVDVGGQRRGARVGQRDRALLRRGLGGDLDQGALRDRRRREAARDRQGVLALEPAPSVPGDLAGADRPAVHGGQRLGRLDDGRDADRDC